MCVCVFPHNKACSLIFNAAETTTSTQSEPGEAFLPTQTTFRCQQETKSEDTVWNRSKHGPRLKQPHNIQTSFQQRNEAFPAVVIFFLVGPLPHICVDMSNAE